MESFGADTRPKVPIVQANGAGRPVTASPQAKAKAAEQVAHLAIEFLVAVNLVFIA